MPVALDPSTVFGKAAGTFRSILFEAEKAEKVVCDAARLAGSAAAGGAADGPGAFDPLKSAMQQSALGVSGPLNPVGGALESEENVRLCDERAQKFGFKGGLGEFMTEIADAFSSAEMAGHGCRVPVYQIALALLSADVSSVVDLVGTWKESTAAAPSGADRQKLVDVAAAIGKLAATGRLQASQVYAYANARVCDIREAADMAAASRTCLNSLRQTLESSETLTAALQNIAVLRQKGDEASSKMADRLESAVADYRQKLDAILPRNLVATTHTWGFRKGKRLETEEQYLEAQANKLKDWLKTAHGRPPTADCVVDAETELNTVVADVQKGQKTGVPKSVCMRARAELEGFVGKDLIRKMQDLYNALRLGRELAVDAEVRKAQELSLAGRAQREDGQFLPGGYTVDLGVTAGLLFGVSASTNIRLGAGYDWKMKIDVDHAGKVTVLSVKGPKGEIGLSAGFGPASFDASLTFGGTSGTRLVYDSIQDFLRNSATDLRVRLHAGGLFHSGKKADRLAQMVDNASFAALLKSADVIRETDDFTPRRLSKAVTDEVFVEQQSFAASLKASGLSGKADLTAGANVTQTAATKIACTPRFANVTSVEGLKGFEDLAQPDKFKSPAEQAAQLADELADFEKAVRRDAWERSSRLRRYVNRYTYEPAAPKTSLAGHLAARGIVLPKGGKVTGDLKARFLASIAASAAAVRIALEDADAKKAADGKPVAETEIAKRKLAKETLAKLQAHVLQPDIDVSVEARRKWLYDTTETNLGRTLAVGGKVTANVDVHKPVVKLLGADMLSGLMPDVKVAVNYQHRLEADRTGIPHQDADRLDITVGTNGNVLARVFTSVIASVTSRLDGAGQALDIAAGALPFLGAGATSIAEVATDGQFTALPTLNIDAGALKVALKSSDTGGVAARIQLVRTPGGAWTLDSVQAVDYWDTSNKLSVSVLTPAALGAFVDTVANWGSTNVLAESVSGKSLASFMRVADEFKLDKPNAKTVLWDSFLSHNADGLKELAANLCGDSQASRELEAYAKLADALDKELYVDDDNKTDFLNQLNAAADALRKAAGGTSAERKAAATGLLTALAKISARQAAEHPLKARNEADLSEADLQALAMAAKLDEPIEIEQVSGV